MKNKFLCILALFVITLDAKPRRAKRPKTPRSALQVKKKVASQKKTGQKSIPQKHKQTLAAAIQAIVQQSDKKAQVGIKVVNLHTNTCLFQKNPDKLFTPASNTKLFTTGAALHILGPSYTFRTRLLTDKQVNPHTINHLYIKGSGDPTLKTKDLESLVTTLKTRGTKEIQGNLIIDSSIFDAEGVGPGWGTGDGPIFDKSPTGGLLINHSCITIRVKPAAVGRAPQVFLEPENTLNKIVNNARTTTHAKEHALHVIRTKDHRIIITGTIAKKSKQKYFRIAIDHPDLYAGHTLHALLKKNRITLKGKIKTGIAASGLTVLATHTSKPAIKMIRTVMKRSDNLYADALFKKMGAKVYGSPGTWAKGKKAVEAFLKDEVGLVDTQLQLHDGSGLSHANKVSPNHITHYLNWIHTKASFKAQFIETLPISGIDGSLRNRMKHKSVHAKVKAKTGSLFGVSSLSGYITAGSGRELSFVIMVNRKNKSAVEFKRKLEDHLCTLLAAHAFSTS